MSFRARIGLAAAVAVAIAVAILSVTAYVLTRDVLYGQVDTVLRERAGEAALRDTGAGFVIRMPASPLGITGTSAQIVAADEDAAPPPVLAMVPIVAADRAVAAGRRPAGFRDADIGGTKVRAYVERIAPGFAVLVAKPLSEVDQTLGRLRVILVVVALVGIVGAALLGLLVARSALRPVRRLTETAEDVARTADLSRRIDVTGDDELNRLAATVNSMLASLERSVGAQRNLVADASHELRTPLTSMRTNVELLVRPGVTARERRRMVEDVVVQLEELTALVGDLVELARDGERVEELEDVRLDVLVADSIERVRRRAPERTFELELEPTLVRGSPARLDRAVVNLLENAVAWGPEDKPIEVTVADGRVAVRDHGPGIIEEDAERLFDRFYRSARARGRPGSGLGLAIVRHVAETHGGRAFVERARGGGARFRIDLPAEPLSPTS